MNDQALSLYITTEHPCGYYQERSSANLIPDPQLPMNAGLYSLLVSHGFRRSGGFVYRPHCPSCQACIPCRIDVSCFKPNRNQRRCLKRNNDLITRVRPADYCEEDYALYVRYINSRHGDGSMANPSPDDYRNFLLSDWGQTLFIETRLNNKLLSIAVSDQLQAGLSAVYTFFDPAEEKRSLGTFAILQQIWLAQVHKLPHVYLGYWIKNHPKMDYKKNFNSLEFYLNQLWIDKHLSAK
ncbi:MAG: arginyltransferase [Gammaproteobacteria bacterium]|nr:arginyltransferase [Gammaproteobacteria bacterium]